MSDSAGVAATTSQGIAELAAKLRATHERLRARPASEIAASLGAAGRRFLDPGDDVRTEALERLPASSGLSSASSMTSLDGMAAGWTEERLRELLAIELGDPRALDALVGRGARTSLAVGPALCVQIAAGGVPGVGVTALLRSLLVKSPTLLKAARGDALLPALYARSLQEVDAPLAESLAVVRWPGGSDHGEAHWEAQLNAALALADVVVAYGSDEAVAAVRSRTPVTARFVAYHHRVSVGVVGREALERTSLVDSAADVALAVAAYDQRGCVSPQIVYVEEGGACTPSEFATQLARALGEAEGRWPGATLDVAEASRLQQARGTAELLAASAGGGVHHGGQAAWTVMLESREAATLTTLPSAMPVAGRFVRVRPIADVSDLPRALRPIGAHLQTVGVAGLGARLESVTKALGEAGASRVAPFGAVPFPPPWWHHDGRGPLLDLVRWVDLERSPDAKPTPPGSAARPSR